MAKDPGKPSQEERIFNIPLRGEFLKAPKNQRVNRASHTIRSFVSRHMKSFDIKISQKVNESLWIRGIQKPPHSIRVKVSRDSGGTVRVMLPDERVEEPKKEKPKGRLEQVRETLEKEKGLPLGTGRRGEILKKGREKKKESEGEKEEPGKQEKEPEEKPKETASVKEKK